MATQKEKLVKATQMAMRIKSMASRLRHDAIDYDMRSPLSYADDMERMANEFLKMK